jgi:hypothetical protein
VVQWRQKAPTVDITLALGRRLASGASVDIRGTVAPARHVSAQHFRDFGRGELCRHDAQLAAWIAFTRPFDHPIRLAPRPFDCFRKPAFMQRQGVLGFHRGLDVLK